MTAPLVWFTDRTRFETGTGRCARKRYLGFHAGPTGYGLAPVGESLPLVTGLGFHEGTEVLDRYLLEHDALPPDAVVREVVRTMVSQYQQKCDASGYRGILAGPHTGETITEQGALLAGMVWAYRLQVLPWLHQQFKVLAVEQPKHHFLSCTCGAGPLLLVDHLARGCEGIVLMQRQDLLAESRADRHLAYFEKKTTGWDSDAWAEQWETKPQLALGTLDTLRDFGREVTELYIIGINKGSRRRPSGAGPEERKLQMSTLCYGYCKPGNPPLQTDDWLPAYEWLQPDGTTKRASRAHRRQGIWTLGQSDWAVMTSLRAQYPGVPVEELWVRYFVPQSVLEKVCFVLGPMNRQDQQLQSLRRSMLAEEERWRRALWELYEHPSGDYEALLDALVPQAWTCRPFGREYECEFKRICFSEIPLEQAISSGHYKPRVPHHRAELEAAVARGLLPAEGIAEETE